MQSKGAIKFVAILLLFAALFQLSFTYVSNKYENEADEYAKAAVAEALADTLSIEYAEFQTLDEAEQAKFIEKLTGDKRKEFVNEVSKDAIYCGYTLKEVQAKSLNLGLDLKGGMSVTLQVMVEDLVDGLAKEKNRCAEFNTAFAEAQEAKKANPQGNFIDLFAAEWEKVKGDKTLDKIFDMQGTDSQILSVIQGKASSATDNSFNVLSRRIDRLGVAQPNIQMIEGGSGRILVELPGVKDPERVRTLLQSSASLEFWPTYQNTEIYPMLNEANRILLADSTVTKDIFSMLQPMQVADGSATLGYAHESDMEALSAIFEREDVKAAFPKTFMPRWSAKSIGGDMYELVALRGTKGEAPLDGDAVERAYTDFDVNTLKSSVSMEMNSAGARQWAKLTGENIGRQIAVVLDDVVYSNPRVETKIENGSSRITGDFSVEEADDLANVLQCGKLEARATIIQETVVGPSLGEKSINAGLISFVIAFALVLLYMILFYSRAGVAADIALLFNVVLLFGTLASFGAVLTLPGIAGLVLTLGMAVDANVIIYERVKEELRAGKGLGKAIADGYSNAYSAIIDGQITTLLTGIVLFKFGSGPVQGFATTLIVGIITSVITSIFITRVFFEDRLAKGKNITFDNKFTRNFLQNTKINFIGKRGFAYVLSGILIAVSFISIATRNFSYGIDFVGGRSYVIQFDQNIDNPEDFSKDWEAVTGDKSGKAVQYGASGQIKFTTTYMTNDEGVDTDNTVAKKMYEAFGKYFKTKLEFDEFKSTSTNKYGVVSSDKVGAAIADETKTSAFIAVGIALFVIFAYIAIRFRKWTWGLGGVVGLAHTAIIVIGFFSLFHGILPFNLDVDQTFIAAILTIIGYAINDTVVIFDRIREYKTLHPKADFKQNVNAAINSTLARTMNTSLTTLVTMLAIAIFGGEAIRGLAVALILGVVVGTYASIFIATPIMYDLTRRSEKRAAKKAAKKAAKNEQE